MLRQKGARPRKADYDLDQFTEENSKNPSLNSLLPRLCWIAHERRRDLARFDGSRDRASMMFQSCFLAVETKERISAKSIAPCNDRKPPEIFCRSFIMRPSRSA